MKNLIREKRFYKAAIILALPMILQGMINVGINIMDTLMLSSLGEAQISASALAGQYINLFTIMCYGLGGGAQVMTSQYWGRGDMQSMRKVVALMMRISFVFAVIFAVGAIGFPGTIMRIFTDEEDVISEGVKYFRYGGWIVFWQALSQPIGAVLRSYRKVKLPTVSIAIGFGLNIFLNWVFIFGNLGAPRMEIAGAALASCISHFVDAAILWVYVLVIDKDLRFRVKSFFMPCGDLLREYNKYSIPVLVSDTLLGLGTTAISAVMGHIGSSFVAANAIVSVVMRLSTVFTKGLSQAGAVTVGNTLGGGDADRAYREAFSFFFISILLGIFASGVILLLSRPIIGFYDITEETRQIAYQLMYACAINSLFQSTGNMLTKGVLRGGGDTRFLMVADIIFLWILGVPLGALAGLVFLWPAFWVYMCLRCDVIIKSVVCTFRLMNRKWISVVKSGETEEEA